MKKQIVFLVLAIFAATSFSIGGIVNKSCEKTYSSKPPRIHIDLVIAKPRSGCTVFPGICNVKGGIEMEGRMHIGLETGAYAQYENGKLTLELSKSEMGDQLISEFGKISSLIIDEKAGIPPSVLKSLQAPIDAIAQTGKYPIKKTENGYIIIIDLY